MIIGVPVEVKKNEARVALIPGGAKMLTRAGHQVWVEKGAGKKSGFEDEAYKAAGCRIVGHPQEVWNGADLILKVKEPVEQEYEYFRAGSMLFTYLHLAADPKLTDALIHSGMTAIAYETVLNRAGMLPLLTPMSEVAGRMAAQVGAYYLLNFVGGKGILPAGVPGVGAAKASVVGGGIVGLNAARVALGLGMDVTILDISADRLRQLDDLFKGRVKTLMAHPWNLQAAAVQSDLLIGAVLVPGSKAPKLIDEDTVRGMERGSVIVDVAVDQGGSIATVDHATTHDNPVYEKHGVIHYAVANMPAAVARTSTMALTNVTLPYVLELAANGLDALRSNSLFGAGLNVHGGYLTHRAVADSLSLQQSYRELQPA
jgi:alanine dehydrogenase